MALQYNKKDLTGMKFNMVTAIEELKERKNNHIMWRCVCDCGNEFVARGASLKAGNTKSCGCLKIRVKRGQRYGRLTTVKQVTKTTKTTPPKWLCKCDCGNYTEVFVTGLYRDNTKSCGCLRSGFRSDSDIATERIRLIGKHAPISYVMWKSRVHERDGYKCQCCGSFDDIESHHKDGWNWCIERRFDLDNGVSLCKFCHADFHKIYGRRNNTEMQYIEFENRRRQLNLEAN